MSAEAHLGYERWLMPLLAAAAVLGFEFGVDLEQSLAARALQIIDACVILAYAGWLVRGLVRARTNARAWLRDSRIDVLVLSAAIAAAAWSLRAGAGLVVVRILLGAAGAVARASVERWFRSRYRPSPSQTVAFSFVAVIAVMTTILMLPAATVDGEGASLTDAVFTITSAVTTTGLVVVDTASYYSTFGLVVLLVAIQIGGLGIMVMGAAFTVLVGGRLHEADLEGIEVAGMGALLDVRTQNGLRRLVASIVVSTFVIEGVVAALLFVLWLVGYLDLAQPYDSVGGALWWSVFYSISAFCHAGFVLSSDSLMPWVADPIISNVFALMITFSQLGFAVIADLWYQRWSGRRPRRFWTNLHVQTRIVIVMTLLLNVVGALAFLFYEYDSALSGLSLPAKVNAAWFQSVTLRSAGFNTIDFSQISSPTVIICVAWMFIGAASGSTGGGIRTNTAAVVALTVRGLAKGREQIEVFGRTIPQIIVYRSVTVLVVAGTICTLLIVLLAATQTIPFDALIFEAVSAFGNVGVSMGVTAELDDLGRWLTTLLMYVGRIGPLTVALAVVSARQPLAYRFPDCDIAVG